MVHVKVKINSRENTACHDFFYVAIATEAELTVTVIYKAKYTVASLMKKRKPGTKPLISSFLKSLCTLLFSCAFFCRSLRLKEKLYNVLKATDGKF